MIASTALLRSLSLFALAGFGMAQGGLAPTYQDLVYAEIEDPEGQITELKLDLYLPNSASEPLPTVIWIHGGAWKAGTKAQAKAAPLIFSGYAVASIDYRLSGEAAWPAQMHDCKAAVRWLRAHAADYGLDPDRFGASGSSAGGHLATFLGVSGGIDTTTVGRTTVDLEGSVGDYLNESSRVQAVVDYYGPTDLLRMSLLPTSVNHDLANSSESLLITSGSQSIQDVPELTSSAGAVRLISRDDAPTRSVQGTADLTVPYEQSERLWRTATEVHGLDWELTPVPDGSHGGFGYPISLAREWFDVHLAARDTRVGLALVGAPSEGGPPALLRVEREGPIETALPVELWIDGSAQAGLDYLPLPQRVVLAPGQTSRTVPILTFEDDLVEGPESLRISVVPSELYLIDPDAQQVEPTLADNDAGVGLPTLSLITLDDIAEEGVGGTAAFRVARDGAADTELSVRLRVRGTARPGVDHDLLGGTVDFAPGSTQIDVVLTALDDGLAEPSETWIVELEPSSSYVRSADRVASGHVTDDERGSGAGILSLICETPLAVEGEPLTFVLTRTGSTSAAVSIPLSLAGSAQVPSDAGSGLALAQFSPGSPYARITTSAVADGVVEGLETLTLEPDPTGTAFVLNDARGSSAEIIDGDLPALPSPSVTQRVGPARLAEPLSIDLSAEPGDLLLTYLAGAPGYLPLLGQPIWIELAGATLLFADSALPDGSGRFTIQLQDQPSWMGARIYLQSFALSPLGQLSVSELAVRRVTGEL